MPVNPPESEFEMGDSQNPMSDPELQLEPNGAEPVDEVEEGRTLGARITSFLRECWIRRRTVFCILVAGTLISVVDALVRQNVYTSSTTLMPPGNSSPYPSITSLVSPVGSAANVLGSEMLGLSDPGDFSSAF